MHTIPGTWFVRTAWPFMQYTVLLWPHVAKFSGLVYLVHIAIANVIRAPYPKFLRPRRGLTYICTQLFCLPAFLLQDVPSVHTQGESLLQQAGKASYEFVQLVHF